MQTLGAAQEPPLVEVAEPPARLGTLRPVWDKALGHPAASTGLSICFNGFEIFSFPKRKSSFRRESLVLSKQRLGSFASDRNSDRHCRQFLAVTLVHI